MSQGLVLTDEFRHAFDLLAGGRHLFLTGKAGTGKSTLIRQFMAQTDRAVVVVAPTGIAALNVDGYTIHRLFGFRTTTTLADVRGGAYRPGRFTKTLASLQTLIIDEASMVRADVFDMLAAALERFGPVPGEPFGGVQIVSVGDLYQLPPVVGEGEAEYFSTAYETPYFFSARSFRREDFPTVSLTTVFRQLGDDRMTAILNEIREGVLLGHAQEQLNARADRDFVPPDDEFWMTLAPTNRLVTARNRQQLERLPGDELVHHAKASGDLSLFDPPVEETLRFKVGAQIMMLNNDQSDRWVNGTIGRVIGVDYDRYGAVVEVEFADGSCADVTPYTWDATRPVVSGGSLSREVIGSYTQLPFKLAWAITIHKAQGQTLERLVVDLSGGMFSTGQLYVALSRCTSLAGLVLKRPVLPKDLRTDRRIARFLRSSVDDGSARRYCAIGMLTVGEEGRMSRPRPVELAVAFDDGTAVSTLINPQRDLADARTAFGINVSDVLLAPTLREAWAVIAPMLAGCTPVGAGIDETLGLIDFELKRLGYVTAMPLGIELADALRGVRVSGRTALERAQSALAAHTESESEQGSSAFEEPEPAESISGLLVSRDHAVPTPAAAHLPALSALLRVSRDVGAVLLGAEPPHQLDSSWEAAARQSVADQLRAAASRVQLPAVVVERLQQASQLLGSEIVAESTFFERDDIGAVLTPGARICFTGTAQDSAGRIVERWEMEELAESVGLKPVKSVTKTRCEVLVIAEAGTQSGKARKAQEYGKPVFTADEFLAWVSAPR
ncbi:AAA family ATPase [Mycobacterium sp. ACS1612]|uniref:AAA family ATPase n=1 Tax=Mycobacterium sp. ACS1612 TaxID=1834117 RepID=UPI0007FBF984|nr:AAA family ATPase [Mycobacterium sp. ACS1612]OBF33074.1 AAA family ATPase [Mycobacterium sp. ACS1612]